MVTIKISPSVKQKFPGLSIACTEPFKPVKMDINFEKWVEKVKEKWSSTQLIQDPIIRAYRDFFWKLGIDPTKIRPSGEALIRRAISMGLPRISTIVDVMNIASSFTGIPLSCFDTKIFGEKKPAMEVRFSTPEDLYYPHTGNPWQLSGAEVVLVSEDKILCLYPYRDSKFALIKPDTRELICVAYGVPGIDNPSIAVQTMLYILQTEVNINLFS